MSSDSSPTARSIKHLTIAIWVLAASVTGLLVFSVVSWVFPPPYVNQFLESPAATQGPSASKSPPELLGAGDGETEVPFYELPIEQQIERASMIAVARFEEGEDGKMRAIITEILKKSPGTVSYYDVGDEHPRSSYYKGSDRYYGDGVVMFFTGSPATMSLSMGFNGDRIGGLGDMPLSLLREKCRE